MQIIYTAEVFSEITKVTMELNALVRLSLSVCGVLMHRYSYIHNGTCLPGAGTAELKLCILTHGLQHRGTAVVYLGE